MQTVQNQDHSVYASIERRGTAGAAYEENTKQDNPQLAKAIHSENAIALSCHSGSS